MLAFFTMLLIDSLLGLFTHVLNDVLTFFSASIAREHEMALRLLDMPFVQGAISLAVGIGGALLGLKVAVESLRHYILFTTGTSDASPFKLVKRTMYAAVMVVGSPWLARTVFGYGAELAIAVARVPVLGESGNPLFSLTNLPGNRSFSALILLGAMVVFWVLIYLQSIIRSVEVAFLSVAGPIMAVGLTGADEGAWAVWWRELVVVSLSQAVQMFMLTGFFATFGGVLGGQGMNVYTGLLGVAWLWIAHRTPAVLRQFAYHTGTGSLASTASRAGSSAVTLVKTLTARRP